MYLDEYAAADFGNHESHVVDRIFCLYFCSIVQGVRVLLSFFFCIITILIALYITIYKLIFIFFFMTAMTRSS